MDGGIESEAELGEIGITAREDRRDRRGAAEFVVRAPRRSFESEETRPPALRAEKNVLRVYLDKDRSLLTVQGSSGEVQAVGIGDV